jgi:isopenicillin-N N-acyltransferase-like protein
MQALAEAADLPADKVIASNLLPELFHCSGFALLKNVTAEGKLYHGRILDYGVNQRFQDHAVLVIQEPQGKVPFVNVGYAGFIGSVTGMNREQISVGEMGGGGVGMWAGIPMAFLVRMALEDARTLDQAVAVFKNNRRTCEYYYVIADGRGNSAVGMWAVPDKIETVRPGEAHPLLPTPVPDTVILSAGERYRMLAERVRAGHGKFTPESALRLMDGPVAMKSNLHDVLMIPADGVLYVANAGPNGEPAWQQKYYRFDIPKLMAERPPAK